MSLTRLLQTKRLHRHQTSRSEIDDLRAVVERDLKDASIVELSADRRFAVAYNGVQQLAKMVLACAGYRVSSSKSGQHATTFEAVLFVLGSAQQTLIDYFDACRRKRNQVNYDHAGVTSDAEADELNQRAEEFRTLAEDWIRLNHPQYA